MTFADGARLEPGAVIWATGFALDHTFVHGPGVRRRGRVMHRRGVTDAPGLYFLGLPWQHTRGSALLGWVKDDAEFIAERIAEHAGTRVAGGGGSCQDRPSGAMTIADTPRASRAARAMPSGSASRSGRGVV